MTDHSPFPSFERPPVNEVVLSVAFDRLPGLGVAHLGDFWHRRLHDELPEIEELPPYGRPVEILGAPSAQPPMNIQLLDRPPSPRLWAKNVEGTRLVQLQPDWFAFNWRDSAPLAADYPRWQFMEEGFLKYLHLFKQHLEEEGFGEMYPRQCEVTYVNQIRPGGIWQSHADIHKVIRLLGVPGPFLPAAESTQLVATYRMRAGDDDRGRLHITVQPTFQRADSEPLLILTLMARGEPMGEGEAGLVAIPLS